jgi:hypothetical protein
MGLRLRKQRRQPALAAKTLRAAGLLLLGFVVAGVTARSGDCQCGSHLRPLRLAQNQNPSPQHPSQFSDRLSGRAKAGEADASLLQDACVRAGRFVNEETSWGTPTLWRFGHRA